MEISFHLTSLARNHEGKSKVSLVACAVDKGEVYESKIIFSRYIDVPFAENHFSVEAYIVKVLFDVSVALQEEGDRLGQTLIAKLMLDDVEHKKRLVTLLLHALPTARNNRPASPSAFGEAGLFAAFTPTGVE